MKNDINGRGISALSLFLMGLMLYMIAGTIYVSYFYDILAFNHPVEVREPVYAGELMAYEMHTTKLRPGQGTVVRQLVDGQSYILDSFASATPVHGCRETESRVYLPRDVPTNREVQFVWSVKYPDFIIPLIRKKMEYQTVSRPFTIRPPRKP